MCDCPLDLQHGLWECPFISKPFPVPPHFNAARKKFPWPSLWLRGLVPREATELGRVQHATGYQFEGLWCNRRVISSEALVFASDASGGPGARDPRAACVVWALAAYRLEPSGPKRVASITCFPEAPLTVAAAEQQAAFELFGRVSGSFDLTVDCKAVTHVLAKQSPPLEGPVPWGECWGDRSRAAVTWVPSHKSEAYFAERNLDEWRRLINADVDALCGARSAEVYTSASRPDLKVIDRLCEDVCLHLAKKVGFILKQRTEKTFPWVMQRGSGASQSQANPSLVIGGDKFVKSKYPKMSKPPKDEPACNVPSPNPSNPKPLNKKQQMLAKLAMPEDPLGHRWIKGAEGQTNLTMKCDRCGLYVQQIADQPSFNRLMSHHCIGGGVILSEWGIHATHTMVNMGVQWSCSKCGRLQRPQSGVGAKQLQKPCDGRAALSQLGKMAQGVGSATLGPAGPAVPKTKAAVPFGTKRDEATGAVAAPKQATLKFGTPAAVVQPETKCKAKAEPKQAKLFFS